MDINRFTERMQEALQAAQSKATRLNHQQLDVEHLLAALLEQEDGLAGAVLVKTGAAPDLLSQRLDNELGRMPSVTGSGSSDQVNLTARLNRLLAQAKDEARRLKDEYVSVEWPSSLTV